MTPERLRALLAGEPGYRVRQAYRAVFREGVETFAGISAFPLALRRRLDGVRILCLSRETLKVSRDGRAHKAVLRLMDGKRIETVLMSPKPGLWTACVSSQVGCALGCAFCATGLMGLTRNLDAEEIADQALFWRQYTRARGGGERLSNIAYMGMGEPMLNLDSVFESLRRLTDPELFAFGDRHLSVSTAGIAPGIERFARAFPQVNLALSLHAATDELRARLVPVNKAYPLARLADSLGEYFRSNRRKVFLEYVLLRGENDRPSDAEALVRFIGSVGAKHLLHVNLIVYNPTATRHFPSRADAARSFLERLDRAGVPCTFRKNLGQDIDGACGQLALREPGKTS